MNKIITVSREFGSGGRELGYRLSEQLNIAHYDQEIISEISKRTELAEWYVEQIIEQKQAVTFPIHSIGVQMAACSSHLYTSTDKIKYK